MAYHPKVNGVNSNSLSGRFLAHNHAGPIQRAFLAADLISGVKYLTEPTLLRAAALARVSRTYVQLALKRQAERAEIEAGRIPLVPAEFVRSVGINRVLEAAVSAEAAQ